MTADEIVKAVWNYSETILNEDDKTYRYLIYDFVMRLKCDLLTKDFDGHRNINFDNIVMLFW
jgi:hypothetical protein